MYRKVVKCILNLFRCTDGSNRIKHLIRLRSVLQFLFTVMVSFQKMDKLDLLQYWLTQCSLITMLVDKKICIIMLDVSGHYHKAETHKIWQFFHIDNLDTTRAEFRSEVWVPISVLYDIPVLITSCIDLECLPTMSPKISILYSVSSLRSVMVMLRSSPPSTSSLGWPGPSVWLTIITKVSKESSSANHVSLKPSGVTSETRRACISGSVSEWQGKVHFLSLCEECFHISGTFQWKIAYQSEYVECGNTRVGYMEA